MRYCAHCIDNPIDCLVTWLGKEYRVCFECADTMREAKRARKYEIAYERAGGEDNARGYGFSGSDRPLTSDERLAIFDGGTFAARRYHWFMQRGSNSA